VGSGDPAPVLSRNLSADGKRVFFDTPEALVAADTDGDEGCPYPDFALGLSCQDVYEWEAKGSGSCSWEAQNGGCIYLISSGRSSDASYFADASASGDDVFFYTRSQLVGRDEDGFRDVYDARVGGGLAAQNQPPPPPPCGGEESCRAGEGTAPPSGSPATAGFSGPPNPKPHRKKPKHHKPKKHHKHKHHRKQAEARAGRNHR
jgi:hypothetical protein